MSERCSQVAVEVLRTGGTASERVTQIAVEVLRSGGTANERVTQLVVEILRTNAEEAETPGISGTVVFICT